MRIIHGRSRGRNHRTPGPGRLLMMILFILLLPGLGTGMAGQAGKWEGRIEIEGRTVRVGVYLKEKGTADVVIPEIHFEAPWNCGIIFQGGPFNDAGSGEGAYFGIDKTNGGKCDDLINGFGMFRQIDDRSINLGLFSENGKIQYDLSLKPLP